MALKNVPAKIAEGIRETVNYEIKVGVSVIKVPYTEEPDKIKITKDVKGNEIKHVEHENKWFEIVDVLTKKAYGSKPEEKFYEVRVDKKEYPYSYPKSLPYFVLPENLENIHGARASILPNICFMSEDIKNIIDCNYMKFEGGQLACKGDGQIANRFNPLTETWEKVSCVCAWNRSFSELKGEVLAQSVNDANLTAEQKRKIIKKYKDDGVWKSKEIGQLLIQGAWRNIKSYDKDTLKYELEPFKDDRPPCDARFELKFMTPELRGVHLNVFSGNGLKYFLKLEGQIKNMIRLFEEFGVSIIGAPMDLVVRMVEKNTKILGKTLYSEVSVEFSGSILELVKRQNKAKFLEPQKKITSVNKNTGEYTEEYDEATYESTEE